MSDSNENERLRSKLAVPPDSGADDLRVIRAVRRARAAVGQRDTVLFALVRIWASLAQILAPLFARLARMQQVRGQQGPVTRPPKRTGT